MPKYFILSAGVNIYDNDENFRLENFKKCFDINFYGVMNFVQAIEKLKLKNKKKFCLFLQFLTLFQILKH